MIPSKAGKGPNDYASSSVSCPAILIEQVVGEEGWKPQKTEWLILLSMALVSLIVAIDATILVTVLPTIATALHGTSVEAFWAATSYLVTHAVVQPALASISEVFGRQPLVYLSLILFTFGSLLCAIAHNVTVLLIGRCIQGIGGGGIITMTQVIYADIVPLRLRPKYLAIVQAAWAIGTMIGPVTGGVLCDRTTWRWIFILNFPFCGLGFICTFLFVRLKAVSQLTFSQKLQKTDWIGTILLTGGLVSLLIGLSWGGHPYAWSSARTISPIVVGIVAIIAFAFWQRHVAPTSLLPLSLFWCRSAVAAYYCALTHGLVVSDNLHPTEELGVRLLINKKVFVGMYYFPFYLMSILGANSTQAGVDQFPALVCVLPGSIIVAALITRLGRFRWAIWGGWAIITLGSGLFQLFGEHTTTAVWATVIAIRGIGTGMVLTSVNVGVQAISKSEDAPMAASMYGFFRSLGMPLGVALSGTIFQNTMSSKLIELGLPTQIAQDSLRYIYILRSMNTTDPARVATTQAYLHGFYAVFNFMTAVSASGLVVSLFIGKFSMNKSFSAHYTARSTRCGDQSVPAGVARQC